MADNNKTFELIVEPRTVTGKQSKSLRRAEIVPGTVYGHKIEAQSIQVPQKDLERVYMRAGSTTLVDLKIGPDAKARKVFIHEVQRTPVGHRLMHVDFIAVNLLEEVQMAVPFALVGESPAVTNGEGVLVQQMESVTVRVLPSNLPHVFEVDVSGLTEVDQALHISDLTMPEGVTLVTPGDEMIVKIAAMRRVEEEEVAEEAAEGEAEAEDGETAESESADES